ncbi:MAG: flagellar M-ring protein FliF [Spirochaetota bacterium]|nr:flagellar M-ring protein FliF [Spirochaetota bacterium]
MPNWNTLLLKIKEKFVQLSLQYKIFMAGSLFLVVLSGFFIVFLSTRVGNAALLYKSPLSPDDYARVTMALQEQQVQFDTKQDQYILVKDPETAKNIRMTLGQAGIIPQNVRGWELFDVQRFTTTDFERDINLRRAIIGEMTKHIKTLGDVEDVSIQVSFPDKKLYSDSQTPVTASIVITPAPYSDIANNKAKIQGIVNLVAYGIPELKKDDVVVVDNKGNVLSDMLVPNDGDEQVRIAREQLRIMERERARYTARVVDALSISLPRDRYLVSADIEFDWNTRTSTKKELIPTVIKPDNPVTPYDDSETVLEVLVSEDRVEENYRGPSYIPEGPAGVDDNVPPGLKDKIDRFNQYEKNQTTRNVTTGTQESLEKKAPYLIKRISISVAIDGTWSINRKPNGEEIISNGSITREYTPIDTKELRSYQELVQGSVGFNAARLDQVVVRALKFDRTAQFALEDGVVRRRVLINRIILMSMFSLVGLIILIILYRILATHLEIRRRQKEEERLRQQALMREAALRQAEAEQAGMELSMEERASNELLDSVINAVREHPQETAKLLRTWLIEEK